VERSVFTSHRFDTELNLYYAGGRMYSPTIGRFISQDTLSLDPNNPDSWNVFSYGRANPTRYVDPTGHMADAATIKNDFEMGQCASNPGACQKDTIDLTKEPASARASGLGRLVGGIGMLASGIAAAPESFGASLALLAVGYDQATTGLVEIVTGKHQKSVAHQVVEKTHLAMGTKPEDAGRAGQEAEVTSMSLLVAGGAGLWAEGTAAPSAMAEVGDSGRVSTLPLTDAPPAMHFDPPLPGVAASEGPVVQSFPEWRFGDPIY
jgi:RHS repeat-associated protein